MKTETQVKHTAILLDDSDIEMVVNDDNSFNLSIGLPVGHGIAATNIKEDEAKELYTYLSQFFNE